MTYRPKDLTTAEINLLDCGEYYGYTPISYFIRILNKECTNGTRVPNYLLDQAKNYAQQRGIQVNSLATAEHIFEYAFPRPKKHIHKQATLASSGQLLKRAPSKLRERPYPWKTAIICHLAGIDRPYLPATLIEEVTKKARTLIDIWNAIKHNFVRKYTYTRDIHGKTLKCTPIHRYYDDNFPAPRISRPDTPRKRKRGGKEPISMPHYNSTLVQILFIISQEQVERDRLLSMYCKQIADRLHLPKVESVRIYFEDAWRAVAAYHNQYYVTEWHEFPVTTFHA